MKLVHLGLLETCGQMMLRSYVQIFYWYKFVRPVGKPTSPSKQKRTYVKEHRGHLGSFLWDGGVASGRVVT